MALKISLNIESWGKVAVFPKVLISQLMNSTGQCLSLSDSLCPGDERKTVTGDWCGPHSLVPCGPHSLVPTND